MARRMRMRRTRTVYVRRRYSGNRGHKIHLIPDLFYLGAVAELFLGSKAGVPNAVDGFKEGQTIQAKAENTVYRLWSNLPYTWKPAAELAVIGVATQYIAKWLHASNIGGKRVKLF